MTVALSLARRGQGRVWPNPAVGCVLVKDGIIVGRGWTQPGGRPHAETEALRRAGRAARDATAYVSLEPCAHHGETPPCAEALVDASVTRVVVAAGDPDPRVAGQGLGILKKAGIAVDTGICELEAKDLNAGFLLRVTQGRPLVTLKLASSLDGRIATGTGESRWISGEEARRRTHFLRAQHDAILVGAGTVRQDNPSLTCRLPGLEDASPVKVVLDGALSAPATSQVFKDGTAWLLCTEDNVTKAEKALGGKDGVRVIGLSGKGKTMEISSILKTLGEQGITRLLVEGGGETAAAFLRSGMVDKLAWVHAPLVLGQEGTPAIASMDIRKLQEAPAFVRESIERHGDDVLTNYAKRQ